MYQEKTFLRHRMQASRQQLSASELQANHIAIAQKLLEAVDWQTIKILHAYRAIARLREVDTLPALDRLLQDYPAITIAAAPQNSYEQTTWWHVSRQARELLKPMPQDPEELLFDCILVPVLAFDSTGNRLGWGGGWYDRFLATQPQAQKVGIAYQMSYVANGLPIEPHDVPLDIIVTETKTYHCRS